MTDLQRIAHNGEAESEIYIKILDSFYRIGDIKKLVFHGEQPKEIFAIEAKGFNEE